MRRLHLALVLPLLVASCGESDPKVLTDQATEALHAGRWDQSLGGFEDALRHMEPGHTQYMRASLGRCTTLVHVDPARAKTEFLKLAESQKGRIASEDFHVMISEYVNNRDFTAAVDLTEAGKNLFPKDARMFEIGNSVADAAKRAGDSKAVNRLNSLGYLGSD